MTVVPNRDALLAKMDELVSFVEEMTAEDDAAEGYFVQCAWSA